MDFPDARPVYVNWHTRNRQAATTKLIHLEVAGWTRHRLENYKPEVRLSLVEIDPLLARGRARADITMTADEALALAEGLTAMAEAQKARARKLEALDKADFPKPEPVEPEADAPGKLATNLL